MQTKVAVVQAPPVLLHRETTIVKVVKSIDEAAKSGASLIVFPEAYVPGYPTWIWRLRPGGDMKLSGEIHARLRENAINLANGDLQPVQDAAAKYRTTVVLGINELDSEFSGTTLFNTVVVIGSDGTLLNRHRKLMPTNPERMVWGMGDASGLRVVENSRWTARDAHLLGKLHATSALRFVCAKLGNLCRSNVGYRRKLDRHNAPYR